LKWTGSADDAVNVYKGFMGSLGTNAPIAAQAPVPESKKEETKAAGKANTTKPAPKIPVKVLRFKTWEISNYGAETLFFPADEVNVGMTFNFFNCEKTKVVIEGKFKNAMLNKCKKMDIKMDEAMSMMEILRCEGIKLTVLRKCPAISIEISNGVQIFTTMESKTQCQLSTTAS
jgi:adenylyl cyclase-associated protein